MRTNDDTGGGSTTNHPSRRSYLGGLGATALAGLAGCLGGVVGGSGGPDEMRIAYMPIYPDLQYFVMQEEGYLDEIPVDVSAEVFPDGPSIVQAYGSGQFDVALFGIVPSMVIIDKGIAAKVVAANIKDAMSVVTTGAFADRFAEEGADAFGSFEAEHGRKLRFGTFPPGSVPDIVLRYWMTEHLGVPVEGNVDVVPMGADQVRQALLAGEIDGTSIMEPIQTIAVARGDYVRHQNAAEFFPGGQPAAVVLMNDRFRNEHGDVGRAFLEQHLRATQFILDDPETAAEHASAVIGRNVLPPETAKEAIRSPTANFVSDPRAIEGGTEIFSAFAHELGKLERELALSEIFDFGLYEDVS